MPEHGNAQDALASLPSHLADAVRKTLATGEAVHWAGQPDQTRCGKRYNSIKWIGVFAQVLSVVTLVGSLTVIPNLPFGYHFIIAFGFVAGIGLYCYPGMARRNAARTLYVITNNRVLILFLKRTGPVIRESCELKTAKGIFSRETDNAGYGDLAFNYWESTDSEGNHDPEGTILRDIADVNRVRTLVDSLRA